MKNSFTVLSVTLLFLALTASACQVEDEMEEAGVVEHRKSPIVIAAISYEDTYLKIVYGQPYKRGRDIFGGLEPYGNVWRTGANEATEITLTEDIRMGGNLVEAGTYSLFTIPQPDEWTVILNNELGQWGAFTYDSDFDYLRFTTPVRKTDQIVEALTISLEETENSSTVLTITWDNTAVDIPVEFL